jgi:cytochrome P450
MSSLSHSSSPTIPGPYALPSVGPTLNYIKFMMRPIETLRHHLRTYGPLSGLTNPVRAGEPTTILAIGPDYNQQVLSNPKSFYALYSRATPGTAAERLTQGVVYMNGERHKQQRRLIMPAFHKKEIDNYASDMIDQTQRLLDSWRPGQVVNLADQMTSLTKSIVVKTLFGLDANEEGRELGLLLEEWLQLSGSIGANLIPAGLPGSPAKRLIEVSEKIEARVIQLLEHKRATLHESRDVVSMLMRVHDEDGSRLSDAEVIANANLLYLAGHETSTNALTWTQFLLSQHPAALAKIVEEIDGVLHGAPPTLEQLTQLPLLEGAINEGLRLFPPLAYLPKTVVEPVDMGGHLLPVKSSVIISHFMTHRLPDIYHEPDKFKPERWQTLTPSPYEFIPFSAGPRMCIGATFAIMEMKIVLAMLLQRYRLSPVPNAEINASIMFLLRSKQMPMVIHAQDRQFDKVPVRGDALKLVDLS